MEFEITMPHHEPQKTSNVRNPRMFVFPIVCIYICNFVRWNSKSQCLIMNLKKPRMSETPECSCSLLCAPTWSRAECLNYVPHICARNISATLPRDLLSEMQMQLTLGPRFDSNATSSCTVLASNGSIKLRASKLPTAAASRKTPTEMQK